MTKHRLLDTREEEISLFFTSLTKMSPPLLWSVPTLSFPNHGVLRLRLCRFNHFSILLDVFIVHHCDELGPFLVTKNDLLVVVVKTCLKVHVRTWTKKWMNKLHYKKMMNPYRLSKPHVILKCPRRLHSIFVENILPIG